MCIRDRRYSVRVKTARDLWHKVEEKSSGYLFTQPTTGRPHTETSMKQMWRCLLYTSHALRLLLVTQCPLHSQDERLTGRTGAVAAVDDRIAYLQTVALSQVLDVVSHRAVSCSSCSSVQQK